MMAGDTGNVAALVGRHAELHPHRLALLAAGVDEPVSFGELWERSGRFAGALAEAGIAKGDRLLVMVPMSIDLYVVLLGIIRSGAVAVFVDPWAGAAKMAAFSIFAEPAGYVGVRRSHWLRLLHRPLRRIPLTVVTDSKRPFPVARYSLHRLLVEHDPAGPPAQTAADDPALITFTTGSSGVPKGANRTHGFLTAQYQALKQTFPLEQADVDMTSFPVFALRNLADGIPTAIPPVDLRCIEAADPPAVAEFAMASGVTTCTASPPLVDALAAGLAELPGAAAPRRILTGGGPVTNEQLRRWRAAFPESQIDIVYGSTEAEPVAHLSLEDRLALEGTRPGICVGRPVDGVRTRLLAISRRPIPEPVDEGEWAVPPGVPGELLVAGDHVCRDYFRNPDAVRENKVRDSDGAVWHRMGDTGMFDEDGRFWLTGRVHTTVFRDGVPLQAQLVESAAAEALPEAERIALVGLPSEKHGEEAVLVVQDCARRLTGAQAEQAVRSSQLPVDRVVLWRRELPLDPRHRTKIEYPELRRALAGTRRNQ